MRGDAAGGDAACTLTSPYAASIKATDSSNLASDAKTLSVTVTREDDALRYTGDTIGVINTNLLLEGSLWDSAASSFPDPLSPADSTLGELVPKVGTLGFTIHTLNNCGSTTVLASRSGMLTSTGSGTAKAPATYTVGTEQTVCVVTKVPSNQFYRETATEALPVTFYINSGQFVTGGGFVADALSRNGRGNFGFNARFTKSGKAQGQYVYVYRGTWGATNIPAVYVVKSNALEGLSFSGTTYPMSATLMGKATVQVNRADNGTSLASEGNVLFTARVTDTNLNDGKTDSMSLTTDGSSAWTDRTIATTNLSGGNIVIHVK